MAHIHESPIQYDHTNLVDLILSNPNQKPETHPLYIDARTGESLTLFRLRRLIPWIHAGLERVYDLKKGDCICVYTPNTIHNGPLYLGALSAGITISPANTAYVVDELERQLRMTRAKLLVAHPSNLDIALKAAQRVGIAPYAVLSMVKDPQQRVAFWMNVLVDTSGPSPAPIRLSHKESRETTAYLCFSSGTTGKSKGVMLSHYNCICMVVETARVGKAWADPTAVKISLGILPMYHMAGLNRLIQSGITSGQTAIIIEKYTPQAMCEAIQRFKVTDLPTAPPVLLHLLNSPVVDQYDLSSVKALNVGSAPSSPDTVRRIMQKFNAPCTQAYGMTEAAPVVTMQTKDNCIPESVGRLLECMQGKVVDPETGEDLPEGSVGEMCVKGPNVMIGYLDDANSTAATIDKDGWLHTGDIARMDPADGNWYIVDRAKELIKYKGFQVAPAELEGLLLECPDVADAAVIGIYDDAQATELPRAYVVLRHDSRLSKQDAPGVITAWVQDRAANHKRLRGGVEILEVIPKSPQGKILRKELRQAYQEQHSKPALAAKL